ncbi:MAG: restriction endonuclease subunit S [Bacteroidales bacterium]|nr:restriction endonuclease subunit S [Bacteroidales bacterium]
MFKVSTPLKKFNANAIQFGTKYRYVVRTSQNNGIRGYLDEDEKYLNPANSISFGQDTATIFYQDQPYFTGDKIKVMEFLRSELNPIIACYLLAVMNRAFSTFQWGQSSFNENILRSVCVALPTSFNGEIDFDYMESYIHELQNESIIKLNDYLKSNGLEKTELTQEEKDAVLQLRSGEVEWKEFRYNEIFNHIEQGRRLKKDDQMPGDIPFVMSGVTNTGVVNYISNPVASFPANSITVDIFGNTFYRDFAYGLGDDTGAYYNDEKQYTKEQMLFIASAMGKSLEGKFSYGNKLRSSQSFDLKMFLPITTNGEIDWAFMQNLITAESRLAIRGVVEWKDKILDNF